MPAAPVILFDGVCNLCNGSVRFIIKRDKKNLFRFASLQSTTGKQLLQQYALPQTPHSIVLIENGKAYLRSTAALRIVRKLKAPWPLLYLFIIIPGFIRNGVYNWVARNRYRWFGRADHCTLPGPQFREKFIG
ncbi:thiol-disulfide oxidoreductase DCC family protein [Niabella drilacis]|uniref:Predicted thiol-disulfide oxidoreductase YuxK, DCC family n=1 Tax=Niabella drilacis (strain DSM 25811 / CCM 8410 / CCUG 62505 / LMG 26954 / E90) TaxID=1285928 RepID=A0A1G6YZT1_NIADE|nr:thiol-disulfide oxidoreductase DCC family protein [Niabella drilacis]SDD96014.1 Predicted thiol-disulfide oxidoreductase YuxK, DCC family [Niabella drilacis]